MLSSQRIFFHFKIDRIRLDLSAATSRGRSGETSENESESGADLAEDVDEFFPEVFVEKCVKERVEASGAHPGQVTHCIDAEHAGKH